MVIYQKDWHHLPKLDANALPASEPKYQVCKMEGTSFTQGIETAFPVIKTTAKFFICFS